MQPHDWRSTFSAEKRAFAFRSVLQSNKSPDNKDFIQEYIQLKQKLLELWASCTSELEFMTAVRKLSKSVPPCNDYTLPVCTSGQF